MKINFFLVFIIISQTITFAQSKHWQDNPRELHYTEDNGDFLLVNGQYRFNRALYGNNLASRVEAGDLPEFALYSPGMAGNLQFVISDGKNYKKLIEASKIETRYRPGSMIYKISDPILQNQPIEITILAQAKNEGLILKMETNNLPQNTKIYAVFGGVSGRYFSRNGDIGADPESGFYLLPEYCEGNEFQLVQNHFEINYTDKKKREQSLTGSFSGVQKVTLSDAQTLENLEKLTSTSPQKAPIVLAQFTPQNQPVYIEISQGDLDSKMYTDSDLEKLFQEAETARKNLTERIQLKTPDRFINNFGETLAVAADGIWESPTFLHGAVAWRMRLNAWRGAYSADVLNWHDRAKEHFTSYSNSQVLEPLTGIVEMDTVLHLARHAEKMGTSVFSSGYISRNPNDNSKPHHYDMNLVFFDQIFSHFNYTGDVNYLREIWPTLERHMNWERRNFRRNGLYDAYCAIWASDGLQYSGGGVTHTSAYNYRANVEMAKLAKLIGKDSKTYELEAQEILNAMKENLWLPQKGHFAEFKDVLGNQLTHDVPGIWTIYHVADAFLLDEFENYQNLQFINNHIPHIPIEVKNQEVKYLYTVSTTNWQPYTWSVNNVALAENLQTALAYWQSGRKENAYQLWKSNLIESMYHGISPGNFQQLSHYDAYRGELYRDFADPIGVAARTLTEGLFGFHPKLIDGKVEIKPGFPEDWNFAEIELPEWSYHYKKENHRIELNIKTKFEQPVSLDFEIPIPITNIKSVKINGQNISWKIKENSILQPYLKFETEKNKQFKVEIELENSEKFKLPTDFQIAYTNTLDFDLPKGIQLSDIKDPQGILEKSKGKSFQFKPEKRKGTFFVQLQKGDLKWWHPMNVDLIAPFSVEFEKNATHLIVNVINHADKKQKINFSMLDFQSRLTLNPNGKTKLEVPLRYLTKGSNFIKLQTSKITEKFNYIDWETANEKSYETLDLSKFYNAEVTKIFEQKYLSPRPEVPTLQLPWQGIGNWCYPLTTAEIDDKGLKNKNDFMGIPFTIDGQNKNVIFTSQWDNFPNEIEIPAKGKAKKLYLVMTGSTNPMQSQMVNAKIEVVYKDGEKSILKLKNPTNWWPIEQDYLDDNFAFEIPDEQIPYRIKLKTGEVYKGGSSDKYTSIKGFTNRAVEGGAATLLDLPLNEEKEINSIKLITESNDVVVGIISATLLR